MKRFGPDLEGRWKWKNGPKASKKDEEAEPISISRKMAVGIALANISTSGSATRY